MKAANKAKLYARAESALQNLYHNATPNYPRDFYGRTEDYFQSWFEDLAQFEIEYLANGGAYGGNYRATLAAPCNAGKYHSEAAKRRYIAHGLRTQAAERTDCGALTGWRAMELAAGNTALKRKLAKTYGKASLSRNDSFWECITDYGKLYQWGRGGRTLAPNDLITQHGGSSFSAKEDYAADMAPAALVDLIRIIESFNRHVGAWCASVPEQWREHCASEDAEEKAAKQRTTIRKAKETRERNYWAARDTVTA